MSAHTRTRRVPVQERGRRTVQRILDAAEELAGEGGVDAATTRAIAERADVAIPSLYRFFADREEIIDALLEDMVSDLDEHAQAIEATWDGGDIDGLVRLEPDLTVSYFESRPTFAALWFGGRASPAVVESVRERNRALAARLRDLLTDRGLIVEETPPLVLDLVVELGDRVLERAFRHGGNPDHEVIEIGRVGLVAFLERWAPG